MSSFTLVYFNLMGRAEPIRYLFAIAGVKYEDKRVPNGPSGEEWAKMKGTTPLGQLPILQVDGKELPQSRAINRYVASKYGLFGSNLWEQARIDVVCETIDEIWRHVIRIVLEKDDAKKEELKTAFVSEVLPKLSANVEKLLKQNKGGEGWFVGDKISLADAVVYTALVDFLPGIVKCTEEHLTGQDALKGFLSRFKSHAKVAEWIKNRPKTNF